MRSLTFSFFVLVGASVNFIACGSQDTDDNTTGSGGNGGGSGVTHCGIFTNTSENTCDACIHQACCPEVSACGATEACLSCALYLSPGDEVCSPLKELIAALGTCSYNHCHLECWGPPLSGSSGSTSSSSGSGS